MKKIFYSIAVILMIVMFCGNTIYAANLKATIDVTADSTEVNAGDTVTFTLKLVNVENAEGGVVSAVEGTVTYDKDFFEEMTTEGITMNSETGKFTKMDEFKEGSSIGKISLKVKSTATGKGKVDFTGLAADDGRDNLEEGRATTTDKSFEIAIKNKETENKETENKDNTDNKEENESQKQEDKENEENKENNNQESESQKEEKNNTENKQEDNSKSSDEDKKEENKQEENKQSTNTNNATSQKQEENKATPTELPKTGYKFVLIPLIAVIGIATVISFAKYKKYKIIK